MKNYMTNPGRRQRLTVQRLPMPIEIGKKYTNLEMNPLGQQKNKKEIAWRLTAIASLIGSTALSVGASMVESSGGDIPQATVASVSFPFEKDIAFDTPFPEIVNNNPVQMSKDTINGVSATKGNDEILRTTYLNSGVETGEMNRYEISDLVDESTVAGEVLMGRHYDDTANTVDSSSPEEVIRNLLEEDVSISDVELHLSHITLDAQELGLVYGVKRLHNVSTISELTAQYLENPSLFSKTESLVIDNLLIANPNSAVDFTLQDENGSYRVSYYRYAVGDAAIFINQLTTETPDGKSIGLVGVPIIIPILRRKTTQQYSDVRDYIREYIHDSVILGNLGVSLEGETSSSPVDATLIDHLKKMQLQQPIDNSTQPLLSQPQAITISHSGGGGALLDQSHPANGADIPAQQSHEQQTLPETQDIKIAENPNAEVNHSQQNKADTTTPSREEEKERTKSKKGKASAWRLPSGRIIWIPVALVLPVALLSQCDNINIWSTHEETVAPTPIEQLIIETITKEKSGIPDTLNEADRARVQEYFAEREQNSTTPPSSINYQVTKTTYNTRETTNSQSLQDASLAMPQALHLIESYQLPAPTPVPAPIVAPSVGPEVVSPSLDWTILPGEGGENLLTRNNIEAGEWYTIDEELLRRFPHNFYRLNDGSVGISQPGTLPAEIENFLNDTFLSSGSV